MLRVGPSPFRSAVTVEARLTDAGPARVAVFDVSGRRVADLVDEERPAGTLSARWDGRDTSGRSASPGVYFVLIEAPGVEATRKVGATTEVR